MPPPQDTQRLFIALNIPAEARRALHEATGGLRAAVPGKGRWVAPDNLHLTLKFLGSCPATALPPLTAMLQSVATGAAGARISIGGVGVFPNLRRPRVVWIGVEHDPKLELLQHDLETACAALGYETEGRPFRPHITLGRLQEPGRQQIGALSRAAELVDFTHTTEAKTLDLMRSESASGGSRYSVLVAAPLGGGSA